MIRKLGKFKIVTVSTLFLTTQILLTPMLFADLVGDPYCYSNSLYQKQTNVHFQPPALSQKMCKKTAFDFINWTLENIARKNREIYEEYILLTNGQRHTHSILLQKTYLERMKELTHSHISSLRTWLLAFSRAEKKAVFLSQDEYSFKALILLDRARINLR